MRSWPRQLPKISINIGGQSSFWKAFSELQSSPVCTIVIQFVRKFGREVVVVVVAASRLRFGLNYLLVMVWTIRSALVWCAIIGERCSTRLLAI
jgi:hypothetical protein